MPVIWLDMSTLQNLWKFFFDVDVSGVGVGDACSHRALYAAVARVVVVNKRLKYRNTVNNTVVYHYTVHAVRF